MFAAVFFVALRTEQSQNLKITWRDIKKSLHERFIKLFHRDNNRLQTEC